VVCNSGVSLTPAINGRVHHFVNAGLYDALFVMQDTETKTLWNHITGEALYGSLVGHRLPVSNLLQMSVQQALAAAPAMMIAISNRPFSGGRRNYAFDSPQAKLSPMFEKTLGNEDLRRPRMDIGLGIWTDATRRYYPMDRVRQQGNAIIDRIDGRSVLIYIEPDSSTPAAIFVDAEDFRWRGKEILLGSRVVVRSGVVYDSKGKAQTAEHPQQIFTRWYGFALTFPGCEIFGE